MSIRDEVMALDIPPLAREELAGDLRVISRCARKSWDSCPTC